MQLMDWMVFACATVRDGDYVGGECQIVLWRIEDDVESCMFRGLFWMSEIANLREGVE